MLVEEGYGWINYCCTEVHVSIYIIPHLNITPRILEQMISSSKKAQHIGGSIFT